MQKMGNHISLAAIGYSQGSETNHVTLKLNVTNHGLSDQVHDDIALFMHNKQFKLKLSDNGSLYQT